MQFEQVFEEELAEVGKRRALRTGMSEAEAAQAPKADRSDLVGLCFSGGGIRSATFNLGVVRGLHRWGLLGAVDYLSTVSGGGYVGSCVANQFRIGQEEDVLKAYDEGTQGEPPGIKRLRGLGRFLTPTGSLGEWLQGVVAVMRGVLWNMAFVVIIAVFLAVAFAFGMDPSGQWIFPFPHGYATLVAVVASLAVVMVSALWSRTPPGWLLSALAIGATSVAAIDLLPTVMSAINAAPHVVEATAVISGIGAVLGSGVLSQIPAKLYVAAARLLALLLVFVVPGSLFLLLLQRFTQADDGSLWFLEGCVGLVLCIGVLLIDFNKTALHGLYKERVGETFLLNDPPSLSAFQGKPGPLHLVNVSLNVPAAHDKKVRDRLADFFTLSCLHVGGERTSYTPIAKWEAAKTDFTLASAVAISGAAAAPNMGSFTDGLIRPIMTLLNIRMGYWAPNPAEVNAGESGWTPRLGHLWKEATGAIDAKGKLVNISDGGHLENLGAFELLRRGCKLIIVGDGEADPSISLGAMATLIRYSATDLDVQIDIDLDDVRIAADGLSTKHGAMGTITYPDGRVGRLLYLKASLTGQEPPDVRYYKAVNADFPHESTADQWFDDAQFDAYLALGEEAVGSLFQRLGHVSPDDPKLQAKTREEQLAALNVVLAPTSRSRSAALTEQLMEVQTALLSDEFDAYRAQLVPTIYAKDIALDDLHSMVPIVMMQLQLMENAVAHLGLVDTRSRNTLANRGWMNVFQRWARSQAFQRLAIVCLPSFGATLSHFMDVGLNLGTRFVWGTHPNAEDYPNLLMLIENNPEVAREEKNRGMITGMAHRQVDGDVATIDRMVMRVGFEGVDRVEAAVAALRAYHAQQGLRVELSSIAADLARGFPVDDYEKNPADREWSPADEAAILSFTEAMVRADAAAHGGSAPVAAGSVAPMHFGADDELMTEEEEAAAEAKRRAKASALWSSKPETDDGDLG